MTVVVTGFYAGILALIALVLATGASLQRRATGASLQTDASPALLESVRRFGNFAEWVPFALLLMAVDELGGLGRLWLHLAGICLVIARIAHPFGVKYGSMAEPMRMLGAGLTELILLILALAAIWLYIARVWLF